MSRNQLEPKSTAREVAECTGFAALTAGALLAWTGAFTPDKIATYGAYAASLLVPALMSLAMVVLLAASVLLVARRTGVAKKRSGATVSHWHYRRRWNAVVQAAQLTETQDGLVKVPTLKNVETGEHMDVVQVRMLPNQTPADWHAVAPRLAYAFGAIDARVQVNEDDPFSVINLVFSRDGSRKRERIAPSTALSIPKGTASKPLALRAELFSLRIDLARFQVRDQDGNKLAGLRDRFGLRVKWGVQWTAQAI